MSSIIFDDLNGGMPTQRNGTLRAEIALASSAGARGILLVPVFRAHRLANAVDQHLLAVVGADHDDDRRRPLRGDQLVDLFRPVVEILAHEAGRPAGAVDDPDVRVLREGGGQAFGEAAAQEIADDQHDARVRTLGDDGDLRLSTPSRSARGLLLPLPFGPGSRPGPGDFRPADLRCDKRAWSRTAGSAGRGRSCASWA